MVDSINAGDELVAEREREILAIQQQIGELAQVSCLSSVWILPPPIVSLTLSFLLLDVQRSVRDRD
jgi:hypothetical protein